MQQVAATTTIVNDTGLVSADQIPAFRAYLVESGFQVRDGGAGQFFHVRWLYSGRTRWLPIERGRAGAPVTPQLLRSYVDGFLRTPLDSAVGQVRAERQQAERVVARAALALPRECAPVEHVESAPGEEVLSTRALDYSPVAPLGSSTLRLEPAPVSADEAQYLRDLRDDFALHAPLVLPEYFTTEQLERFVQHRWHYADLMMAARTTQAGD